jgi:hypothetical protein
MPLKDLLLVLKKLLIEQQSDLKLQQQRPNHRLQSPLPWIHNQSKQDRH